MEVRKKSNIKNIGDVNAHFDAIETCSRCNKAIVPEMLYNITIKKGEEYYLYTADFCSSCKSVIITEYKMRLLTQFTPNKLEQIEKISSYPIRFEEEKFDKELEEMSPQFVKIYNQALQAEKIGLDEIAGLGYRKAIEFLIKDFAIYENPDNDEEIKNTWMKNCIEKYINDDKIKVLAEKADWIGNDEAHYIRKQTDRDVKDMKKFIKAIVYFIGITLITRDAYGMKSKNN